MSTANVEFFPPTAPHAETRQHALERIVREAHLGEGAEPLGADLLSAMGGNRRIALHGAAIAAAAAVIGAVAGLLLSVAPGPFEVSSAGGTIGYMLVLGLAVAVIAALIGTLVMLEGVDGRVEHMVEEQEAARLARGHAPTA